MPQKVIEQFNVPYLQILDEQGVVDGELEPAISNEQLLAMYRASVLARAADQRIIKLQRQGRMGTYGPSTGHEAASIGPAFAMAKDDWLVGTFRELGGRLVRGEPLLNQLLYWNGFEEGNVVPEGSRILPISVIIGSHIPHAAGIGYAMRYRQEQSAVVCFFGDGASSEGDFHEGLNFAAVWQAPVVYICLNNQWAISVPRSKQTRSRTIAQKAIAYGMPGIQVDGNDILAMYQATSEALERARAGDGPTLIEAVTYRMTMHTTADDPSKYRSDDEVEQWQARDPLTRFQRYLEQKKLWDEQRQTDLETEVKAEVDGVVKEFEARAKPTPDTPFDHVYGTSHDHIEEQRRELLATLEGEAANG